MKILKKDLDPAGKGFFTLKPENPEDMWHAYNLVQKGDLVTCATFRKINRLTSTGSSSSSRVKCTLTVHVSKVDFEPKAGKLRVSGPVTTDAPGIKKGAFHTLELEAPRKFTVAKELWDSVALDMIKAACDVKNTADLAAVVMEMGLAHVCLVTSTMTIVKQKIELAVPRKRAGSSQHEKQRDKFFDYVIAALVAHVDFAVVKAVVIASPGFVKDQFMEHLTAQFSKRAAELQALSDNRHRFVKARASSGHKHSLKEVLQDPSILEALKDVKAAGEVAALARFYDTFNTDSLRAVYGFKHVCAADEAGAVEELLMTNELFRVEDVKQRQVYVALTESVKGKGGAVHIFSTLHPSGEQLRGLTGIAATLRFPLDLSHIDQELDGNDSTSSSSSDEDGGRQAATVAVGDEDIEGDGDGDPLREEEEDQDASSVDTEEAELFGAIDNNNNTTTTTKGK